MNVPIQALKAEKQIESLKETKVINSLWNKFSYGHMSNQKIVVCSGTASVLKASGNLLYHLY